MIPKNKTLLIVGGTGVLSYAVVLEAINQGFQVTCINRGLSKSQKLPAQVEIIKCDYRNENYIQEKLKDRTFDSVIDVLCYNETDIDYSLKLFHNKCKQYVFISSCAVYNKGKGDFICTENSPLISPIWEYSINKVKCENLLKEKSKDLNLKYTIIRPAVTYGDTRIPYGITPSYGYHSTLIYRILNNKPIILWDEGQTIATITHVEDFAKGIVGILGKEEAFNNVFNVVGDERHTWKDVIDVIGEILGKEPVYFNISKELLAKEMPQRKGEILDGRGINQFIGNSKIKSIVPEFKTHIKLKDGLKRTIEYYKNNSDLKGIDYYFDGNWDRIIRKYEGREGKYKINFVDYKGNASIKGRIKYYKAKYSDNFILILIKHFKKYL